MRRTLRWSAAAPGALLAVLFLPVSGKAGGALSAQATEGSRAQTVSYFSPDDSTYLTASLTLPPGSGPHPGVVLLSIAGTDLLVDRLAGLGYAVLIPARRGFVEVEPLLRATYQDLANDAQAAVEYLRARPEVEDRAMAVVAQADDAPPGMIASAASGDAMPLILLAPPGFPGREVFRLEQRGTAERDGARPQQLEALDRYVEQIADVVLSGTTPFARSNRLRSLRASTQTRLPYNAAFPSDESQIHFFSSPLWHDRMAFEPEQALARLRAPVLVLIGSEDPNTPMPEYLAAVRRGLSAAATDDWTVCRIPGRTRHTFSSDGVEAIVDWLEPRMARAGGGASPRAEPRGCLADPAGASRPVTPARG
jgi:pimeloyl-ACP methyl ester carboxylesterase